MGNFSRDTFDRLKHYAGVRLQQGVPIVDADWNELEDIRKYELQTFLKWFVGSGVPKGNDGFHILPAAGFGNDFTIQGGDGTAEGAGRCLVDGWDVIIENAMRYTEQPLYVDPTLATTWGVDPLPSLSMPGAARTDQVYLDVWEREVNALEDTNLVNTAIGVETCVRRKREWVVRVAEGIAIPTPGAGHSFYHLATLNRPSGQAEILDENIADLRLTGLVIPSYLDIQQISQDAYGPGYTLDHDGQPNLKVSLRDAINALLRGGLPSTPQTQLTFDTAPDYYPFALRHSSGDISLFWTSYRSGNYDIWYKRYSAASDSWSADTQLSTGTGDDYESFALEDHSGNVWVFWYSYRGGNNDIWYNLYTSASGSWGGETQLTTDPGYDNQPFAVVGSTGDLWVFWASYRGGNYDIWFNRYNPASGGWAGASQLTTTTTGYDSSVVAVVDGSGNVWVFWQSYRSGNYDIWYKQYTVATNSWGTDVQLTYDTGSDESPFALVDNVGDIWVFWISSRRSGNTDIWYKRYDHLGAYWEADTQLTTDDNYEYQQMAFQDSQGDIWAFWSSNNEVQYKRFSRESGWGRAVLLSAGPDYDYNPVALEDNIGDIWVIWQRYQAGTGNSDIWYRKLIPSI